MSSKVIVMLDRESLTGSVKIKTTSSVPLEIVFEGEKRLAEPKNGVIEEDFYVLCTRLWEGQDQPELYSVKIGDETITFGLRELGLDAMRGFYLNGRSYPLRKGTVEVVEADAPSTVFSSADASGLCLLVKTCSVEDVVKRYNHPSIVGWILPNEADVEKLREVNRCYYGEDKTRPTFFLVPVKMDEADPALKVADVNLFSPGVGEEEVPGLYHKHFPYRCLGVLAEGRVPEERLHILNL